MDPERNLVAPGQRPAQALDGGPALIVHIPQRHLLGAQLLVEAQQPQHQQRHARAGTAQNGYFHRSLLKWRASSARVGVPALPPGTRVESAPQMFPVRKQAARSAP